MDWHQLRKLTMLRCGMLCCGAKMTFDTEMTVADAMTDFPGLSRVPAAFLVRLHLGKGRIVPFWDLQMAIEGATGNLSTIENLRSAAKRARASIKGYGKVISASGVGYRLEWQNM